MDNATARRRGLMKAAAIVRSFKGATRMTQEELLEVIIQDITRDAERAAATEPPASTTE